jgi:uncharacterized membrane protein YphA (DoxX/SURF4 family)
MHSKGENKMRRLTLWGLTVAVAGMFALAGTMKLAGAPMQVELFAAIGIGQWFRYLTGGLELVGAIGLFVPAAAPFAALVLAAVMVGAVLTHLAIVGGNPIVPIALFFASIAIAFLRSEQFSSRTTMA